MKSCLVYIAIFAVLAYFGGWGGIVLGLVVFAIAAIAFE